MHIKKITSQYRHDFRAIIECEHCGNEQMLIDGYDDEFYHQNVVPEIICGKCGKKAEKENYRALAPKYKNNVTV